MLAKATLAYVLTINHVSSRRRRDFKKRKEKKSHLNYFYFLYRNTCAVIEARTRREHTRVTQQSKT